MTARRKSIIMLTCACLALATAALLGTLRFRDIGTSGERGLTIWFYDQSERQLYTMPRDAIAPDKGVGGAADDGVRAIVVASRAESSDPAKRRIAYLETYTPQLKQLLEDRRAAQAAGRAGSPIPAGEDFLERNTLVRRVGDAEWVSLAAEEGQIIQTEWRSWPSADGSPLVVCMP